MEAMTLREVCNMVGVTRRAVQCYEKEELVTSTTKNKYGYLLYDEEAVKRIREVKMYQDFGFTLKEIKVLLIASDDEYADMLGKKLNDMRKRLSELETIVKRMEELIESR